MRASAGDYDAAISLMASRREGAGDWPLYVDGTLAFLKGDQAGLETAIRTLEALPEPPWFKDMLANSNFPAGFRPTWPPNLAPLKRLRACFGQPYREAYSCKTAG